MKKLLLISLMALIAFVGFAATITVTPADYESVYNSAADGDILMLDAGEYATALEFPVDKTITLKKLPSAASLPLLTFAWASTNVPVAGSGLILDGLEINLNDSYYIQFPTSSVLDKFVFKNCTISNINRCLVRASNSPTTIGELTIENCIIKDCGSGGYCLNWIKGEITTMTVKNITMYNYQSEGFLLSSNAETNTLAFVMQNNTLYQCGKDGDYSWCTISLGSGSASTYDISNNIISKPYSDVASRSTIIVPEGSGTVTCKNNLVIDYPNFSTAPLAGWDAANNTEETGTNYFADAANFDFSLSTTFPYKGTDNNYLGDSRWWPVQGSYAEDLKQIQVKAYVANGMINVASPDIMSSIEIYTVKGSMLFSKNILANEAHINANAYQKGIYILKIKSENRIATQKIIL